VRLATPRIAPVKYEQATAAQRQAIDRIRPSAAAAQHLRHVRAGARGADRVPPVGQLCAVAGKQPAAARARDRHPADRRALSIR
jgi:hypothetical protein